MKSQEGPRKELNRARPTIGEEPVAGYGENRVGDILRRAREEKGVSLKDVTREIKIRYTLLEDLERGNMENLPVQTFSVGFLKLYIRYLALPNEESLVAQFIAQMKPQEHKLYYSPPPLTSRNRPGPILVMGGLLLFLGCFSIYEMYWRETPTLTFAELGQQLGLARWDELRVSVGRLGDSPGGTEEIPAESKPEVEPMAALPVVKPLPPREETAPSPVKPVEEKTPPPSGKPEKPAVTAPEATASKHPAVEEPPPEEEEDEGAGKRRASPAPGGQPLLLADEKVWVQLKNKQKQVVKEWVIKEGETFPINLDEFAFLTVGNAGGVRLRQGGVDSLPLGPKGKVLRNMELTASIIQKKIAEKP